MKKRNLILLTLTLIPYIHKHEGVVSEKELAEKFGLDKQEIEELCNFCLLLGYPPYTPETFFDLSVDDENPDNIKLWIPEKGLLSSPVKFTLSEVLALKNAYSLLQRTLNTESIQKITEKFSHLLDRKSDRTDDERKILDYSVFEQGFNEIISVIERSIKNILNLKIEYYSASRDALTSREIQPYMLINYLGLWYLIAYCMERDDYRFFRCDRIKNITETTKKYEKRSDFDPEQYLDGEPFGFERKYPDDMLVLRFKKRISSQVMEEFPHGDIKLLKSGDILVRIPLRNPRWLMARLRKHQDNVKVISPENFKDALLKSYRSILEMYK
jgi:proteasome accessory factor C